MSRVERTIRGGIRLMAVVAAAGGLWGASEIANRNSKNELDGAGKNFGMIVVPTETSTAVATGTPRATVRATATNIPDATRTSTSVIRTPSGTPSQVPTEAQRPTSTATKKAGQLSSFHIEPGLQEEKGLFATNRDGVMELDLQNYQKYLTEMVEKKGIDEAGKIDQFAMMLAAPIGRKGLSDEKYLDFWRNPEVGGRGWEKSDVKISDYTSSVLNSSRSIFTERDGILRGAVRAKAKDVEGVVANMIARGMLQKKNLTPGSDAANTYLRTNDARIKKMVEEQLSENGFVPVTLATEGWEGAKGALEKNVNFKGDTFTVCIKAEGGAARRDGQREYVVPNKYQEGLERVSKGNNERLQINDSSSDIVVYATIKFGRDDGMVVVVIDIQRLVNRADGLDGSVSVVVDDFNGKAKVDGNPWVPCGEEEVVSTMVPPTAVPTVAVAPVPQSKPENGTGGGGGEPEKSPPGSGANTNGQNKGDRGVDANKGDVNKVGSGRGIAFIRVKPQKVWNPDLEQILR